MDAFSFFRFFEGFGAEGLGSFGALVFSSGSVGLIID
jgi:hypothetical protein